MLTLNQFLAKHNFHLVKDISDEEGYYRVYKNDLYTVTVYTMTEDDKDKAYIRNANLEYVVDSLDPYDDFSTWDEALS